MSKSPSAQDIINLLDASPYEMKVKDMADVFKLKVSSKAYDQMRRKLHRLTQSGAIACQQSRPGGLRRYWSIKTLVHRVSNQEAPAPQEASLRLVPVVESETGTITGVTARPTGVSLAQLQDQADKYQAVIECLKDSLRNEKCKLQVILDLIRQGGGTAPTQAGLFDG